MPAPATATLSALVTASPFAGTPAVGALFTMNDGRLGTHFCTASVVHSPEGNLILTAAHCLAGYSDASPATIAFVPGYVDGASPEGIWLVTRIFVDRGWAATQNPDDDFAFLTVAQPGGGVTVIGVIGGYQQGGDSADVSYAAAFGPNVQALYDVAVAQG
jgi:Trypsin